MSGQGNNRQRLLGAQNKKKKLKEIDELTQSFASLKVRKVNFK